MPKTSTHTINYRDLILLKKHLESIPDTPDALNRYIVKTLNDRFSGYAGSTHPVMHREHELVNALSSTIKKNAFPNTLVAIMRILTSFEKR